MVSTDVPIRPAATVILLRERAKTTEVLMLHRNQALVFGGGHWVFPGGRIDEEDKCQAPGGNQQAAAKLAAIRETREEAGLNIAANQLTPVSYWTTPAPSPKRYNTAFFVTRFQHQDSSVVVDGSEIVDHEWLTPMAAIEHYDAGDKLMMPPTIHTLREIANHDGADAFIAMCANRSPLIFDS